MGFDLQTIISICIAFVVAITVHECAHAWVANLLGDPTAKHEGRLSLNPLRHLDPLGTLTLILFRFGWGKPVPVNSYNLRHPLRDNALISLAGPASNLVTAAVLVIIVKHILMLFSGPTADFLMQVAVTTVSINIVLMLFNLIPLPPLDGSKLLFLALGKRGEGVSEWLEEKGPPVLFAVIIFSSYLGLPIFKYLISIPADVIITTLYLAS